MIDDLIFAITNLWLYATHPRLIKYYWRKFGRFPNISNPQRYSERMLWRKLLDHNPQFVLFSDKLATKEYMKRLCPDLALPRTLWVGNSSESIPDELLRGDVFVKANHGCNFNQRIQAGRCNRAELQRQTKKWLRSTFGKKDGQWAYSRVEPKLFVEESIGDAEDGLLEFNVRASDGQISLGSVIKYCKTPRQWFCYLDAEGETTPGMNTPEGSPLEPMPDDVVAAIEPYRRAVQYARHLSIGVDYARFDFMWNGRELFGGEITVYPSGGLTEPTNVSAKEKTMNSWDLNQSHFVKSQHTGWKQIYAEAMKRRLKETAAAVKSSSKK